MVRPHAPHAQAAAALSVCMTLAFAGGCDSKKEHDGADRAGAAALASGSLVLRQAPAPPTTAREPEKPLVKRPKDPADLLVTPERRARVESLVPEAKGFTTTTDLEEQLYKLQLKRGKDADAVKALDQIAKGRWVLFTGNIGSLTPASFELPVRYTPRDPNDPMGITSVWIAVQFTDVKGYDAAEYRAGELAVVLAKYDGAKKASPGHDVVLLQRWFE
jgi:hypothetical protein